MFQENDKSIAAFLKADLYKKPGNHQKYKETLKKANEIYNFQISQFKTNSEKENYEKILKNTKAWNRINRLKNQQKEYKFTE